MWHAIYWNQPEKGQCSMLRKKRDCLGENYMSRLSILLLGIDP